MASQLYSGTHAVDSTEWSCTTDTSGPDADTTPGTYQVFLDVSDMIAGDTLQIRAYDKCRVGDTQRLLQEWILVGVQASPLWASPLIVLLHGWDVTAKALAGTITVLWSIRSTVDTNVALIKAVTDLLPNAGALSSLATAAALDTIDNFLDNEITAIKAVTDMLPDAGALTSLATAAALDTVDNFLDTEIAAIKAVTDLLPNGGALSSLATAAAVDTVDNFLDTEVAAIKTETDKIAATITKVDAIQAKTDSLTFTVAGQVDVNIESVNAVTVNGDGAGTPWGP